MEYTGEHCSEPGMLYTLLIYNTSCLYYTWLNVILMHDSFLQYTLVVRYVRMEEHVKYMLGHCPVLAYLDMMESPVNVS